MVLANIIYTTVVEFTRGDKYSVVAAYNKYNHQVTYPKVTVPSDAPKELIEQLMDEAEIFLMKKVEEDALFFGGGS